MSKKKQNGIASEWDATYKKLTNDEVLWSIIPEIEDFIVLARKEKAIRVLDAACGDGKNLADMVRIPEFFCVGCDSSPSALNVCQREVIIRNKKNVEYGLLDEKRVHNFCLVECQLEDMPFPDDHFDAAICIDVINHSREPYEIFNELKRVVKKNGLMYFSLFNIEDEIISGDKHKDEMKPMPGGIDGREYIYSQKNSDGDTIDYYFRFLHENEIDDFMAPSGLEIIEKKVKIWINPPHPHFRNYEHAHCNHMVIARNKK